MAAAEHEKNWQTGNSPRLLIVDGHAYAYRAFFAIRQLTSPTGQPTNAIYGFIKMLGKLQTALQPSHQVVVWDCGLAAERVAALPMYKAHRPAMPAPLEGQITEIHRYLEAAHIASLCEPGVEADDRIANIAHDAAEQGFHVAIASSDKDFMQLVAKRIQLVNPSDPSLALWTAEAVTAKTGVAPDQIVDWLSLVGDSVDNIPGVPGVGHKTASSLLQQFGSIDGLWARLSEVKSEKVRASVAAARSDVERNRQLIRLRIDLPGAWRLEDMEVGEPDLAQLQRLYEEWGFRTLRQELEAELVLQQELI